MELTSPVERWPGVLILPDYLTISQCVEWESGVIEAAEAKTISQQHKAVLPAILGIVQEWRLENFPQPVTAETFPGTPRNDSMALLSALITAVRKLYSGEEITDPNE